MSLKKLITELADLNNVYKYTNDKSKDKQSIYSFTTESGVDYGVGIYNVGDNSWLVGFDSTSHRKSKRVDPRKIFNTVFKIVEDFYNSNKNDIDTLVFHADKKRERIYKYYVDKLFPNSKVEPDGHDPNAFIIKMK